ncbi:hypothetical protein [Bradyrhizobium sp. ISRA443]
MEVVWVYGVGEGGFQAFSDFGIESLTDLIKFSERTPRAAQG